MQKKPSPAMLELIFDMNLKPSQLGISAQNRLKISCALLNKMGKSYNMSVLSECVGEELSNIRVIWEVSEA